MSPPLIDQGSSTSANYDQRSSVPEDEDAWLTNPQIRGLAISASGICGQPNYIQHGGCTVCRKPFATIKEEITSGYLEKTHVPGENFAQRIRRRNAFLAGMRAKGNEFKYLFPVAKCTRCLAR